MTLLVIGLLVLYTVFMLFMFSFSNWRQALLAVLVLVVFEGALRKWVFPQGRDLLYFLKDLVLIPVYLSQFGPYRAVRLGAIVPESLKLLLFLNVVWCLVQTLNPALGSPVVGLLGIRAYLFYIPLLWVVPRLFADKETFIRFVRYYLLLSIPIGILGIAQYFSSPTSPINLYVGGEITGIALIGTQARITGTFSYIAGYSVYLMVSFSLLIPLLFVQQRRIWYWLTVVELILLVANALMTGSRGLILAQILIVVGFFAIQAIMRPVYWLSVLAKFAIPAVVLGVVITGPFQLALDNFVFRAKLSDSLLDRVIWTWTDPYKFVYYTGLSGYGTGATHPGGKQLRQQLGLPNGETLPVAFEPEMGRVMLELGPFGFLLWYGLRLYLAFLHLRVFLRLKTETLRHYALIAFLVSITHLDGSVIVNPTLTVYYWFLNSFIILLPQFEQNEERKRLIQEATVNGTKTTVTRARHRQPQFT